MCAQRARGGMAQAVRVAAGALVKYVKREKPGEGNARAQPACSVYAQQARGYMKL